MMGGVAATNANAMPCSRRKLAPREVGRAPSPARDPLVAPGDCTCTTVWADEGVGRGPGGPPYLRNARPILPCIRARLSVLP